MKYFCLSIVRRANFALSLLSGCIWNLSLREDNVTNSKHFLGVWTSHAHWLQLILVIKLNIFDMQKNEGRLCPLLVIRGGNWMVLGVKTRSKFCSTISKWFEENLPPRTDVTSHCQPQHPSASSLWGGDWKFWIQNVKVTKIYFRK